MALTPEEQAEIDAAVKILKEDHQLTRLDAIHSKLYPDGEPVEGQPPAPPIKDPPENPEPVKRRFYWGADTESEPEK